MHQSPPRKYHKPTDFFTKQLRTLQTRPRKLTYPESSTQPCHQTINSLLKKESLSLRKSPKKTPSQNLYQRYSASPEPNHYQFFPQKSKEIVSINSLSFKLPEINFNLKAPKKVSMELQQQRQFKVSKKYSLDENHENLYMQSILNKRKQQKWKTKSPFSMSFRTKAGCNMKTPKINQDIAIIDQKLPHNIEIFCICDGHGSNGHLVAAFIKHRLLENLKSRLKKMKNTQDIKNEIYFCLKKTSTQLLQSEINTELSGSTLVLVAIYKDKITCFNVGDSRAILINSQSNFLKAQQISFDHKPDRKDQSIRILAFGGRIECQTNENDEPLGPLRVWMKNIQSPGLAMTRSFGDKAGMKAGTNSEPEITQVSLEYFNKYLIIASDGVWQHIESHEVPELLFSELKEEKIQEAADKLMNIAIKQWDSRYLSRDDITLIIVKLNNVDRETETE